MKKLLIILVSIIIVLSIGYAFQNNTEMKAAGSITGSNNHEAGSSLQPGDQVHMGGSALSDDEHTVIGIRDGYVYLLRKNAADNGVTSFYTNALDYANNTYKTQLGALGNAYISQAGNIVGLISKGELNSLGLISGDELESLVPQLSGNWWLRDASNNRAGFVSANNSLNEDGGIYKTSVSGNIYSSSGGTCRTVSANEQGVMLINSETANKVLKKKSISSAIVNLRMDLPARVLTSWARADCAGDPIPESIDGEFTSESVSARFTYENINNVESWYASSGGEYPATSIVAGWRPRPELDSSGNLKMNDASITQMYGANVCRNFKKDSGNPIVNGATDSPSNVLSIKATKTFTVNLYAILDSSSVQYDYTYCSTIANYAGTALIRPYLKFDLTDVLMRNTSKRNYSLTTKLNEANVLASDNSGEYLTIQTNAIDTALRSGASGVSENHYTTSKPKTGTVISLPLSFSGPIEGNRYVSAEAVDKNGNTVYGVLKSVGSAANDSVDIDFENLLTDGTNSFQVTLYLEDEGSKNTAYRSEGTTITVEFQQSTYPLAFTNPDVTNIKIGSNDVKETITTNNPEITTISPNAAVYTLSGGISGTGLSVTNDSSNPKGFIISVGNTPNPSLPADFTLTAELETTNSTKATATKQLHLFQGMSEFKWIPKKTGNYNMAEVGSNVLLGNLEVQNGLPKYSYSLTIPSDSGYDISKAKDNGNFTVTNNALESGQKAEVKTNTALLPGTYYIQCKVTDSYGDVLYTDFTITVSANEQTFIFTDLSGNQLPINGNAYLPYSETFDKNKKFQLYTAGNPTGSTVTYQLKAGSPTDVISVDNNGLVTILNASLNNQMGKVIVQATSRDPSGNYNDMTIELPINIEKGTRTITFAENPIYVSNGKGKVTPVTEVDGATDSDGDVLIEVDSYEDGTIAWTNDNKTIDYNYSGQDGIDIKIHATKPMNRNYKAAEADGMIHIMGPDENILAITSPGQIIYGDHFTIRSSQYDADSTDVQYTFEVDDSTYISTPTVSGNSAQFDAIKYSGTNKTTITVTRTADGETPLSKKVQVTVLPKPIEIIIDDQEKYKGEQNPPLTYQDFRTELVSWNGVQDIIQENDIKLSTTAKTDSNAGSYPIKGDANTLNKTYPNYSFSFKEGILTIKEENIEDDWYHLEIDDGNNTAYTGSWTNQNVNIISDHPEYINLSLDQSTWNPTKITVSKEGETNQSFWMKKDSGAITKEKQELIKIDKSAPKVKGIKAKDTNNKLQDIINKLTAGIFFKPGTAFEITTDDSKDDLKVSGTKEIAYKVYKVEQQARSTDELIKEGKLNVTNEKASITISETVGKYKVCVIPSDNAGNTNTESCHEVELKKIDVDVDGDGKFDFNDPDGDGCPDLNIKWKDPNNPSKWIVINGDRNNDGIPDLNIDSDGNGKADLNVDTDNDGNPDLNIVKLKKQDWKPTICVKADIDNGILEEYCTGTTVKAVINVDTDGDGIPDINIDTNGDGKADMNIDTDDDGKPNLNTGIVKEWHPDKLVDLDGDGVPDYKTDSTLKGINNIDTDKDGYPDLNLDLDLDGLPELNINTDGKLDKPQTNIDSDGDGKPDINIDENKDGKPDKNIMEITEWKPNHNVSKDGKVIYDTMEIKSQEEPTDEPINPNDNSNTSVKGIYNPVNSMGGANTGDTTNLILQSNFTLLSLMILLFLSIQSQIKKD